LYNQDIIMASYYMQLKSNYKVDKITKSEPHTNYQNPNTMKTSILQELELHREDVRRTTFEGFWSIPFIDKNELAMLGFYYIGPVDKVKCFFCHVQIDLWVPEDNVLIEHLRWSPYCSLINHKPTKNIPMDVELLKKLLPEPSFDVCGHGARTRESSYKDRSIENKYLANFQKIVTNLMYKLLLQMKKLKLWRK
jgi:Inhibitor of Apoptosis domain